MNVNCFDLFGGKAEAPVKRLQLTNADNLSESDMHLSERDTVITESRFRFFSIAARPAVEIKRRCYKTEREGDFGDSETFES